MARIALLVVGLFGAAVLALAASSQRDVAPAKRPAPKAKAPATKTLRVLRSNPRYFTNGSGHAVYLTGSHVWWSLVGSHTWKVDCERGRVEPFDFERYLDLLAFHNHNFIRLWAIETPRWDECGDSVRVAPQPWLRTGPGLARDGLPRFDLRRLNPAYFNRLRARVRAAAARGIYVSVMLFEGWGLQWHGDWRWRSHPFHGPNNVNGIEADANGDGSGIEAHTLAVPAVTRIQRAYVRRVVDAVNEFDNVLYEIANESGAYSTAWQYHMIDLVKRYERGRKRHPVGMTFQHAHGSNAALARSRADWVSPFGLDYISNPPVADGRKVVLSDTDHQCGGCGDHTFPWRSLLRGHNPIYMDSLDDEPRKHAIRSALGQTRRYAGRIDLAAVRPRPELASTGYCLASRREYLVYQPEGGALTVDLTRTRGLYSVEWFDPARDRTTSGERVSGGGVLTFTPPFAGQAVLYLRRVEVH
jgi:Family of unknown function (DUF6298)/Putative collagen-binding domain of a collagenase